MVIKATIFVTKLNDSSVNCVNDKIVAAIRLNTTAIEKMVSNPISIAGKK